MSGHLKTNRHFQLSRCGGRARPSMHEKLLAEVACQKDRAAFANTWSSRKQLSCVCYSLQRIVCMTTTGAAKVKRVQ